MEQRGAVIVVGPSFPVARTRSSEARQCSYSVSLSTVCVSHAKEFVFKSACLGEEVRDAVS